MGGHTNDTCFKLHGYPEWYKKHKEQRSKVAGGRNVANMVDNPLDVNMDRDVGKATDQQVSFTAFHFALRSFDNLDCGTWIIDTSASNHMFINLKLLHRPKPVTQITPVSLLDGSVKLVHQIGDVHLSPKLTLADALYIPSFKFNLLSIGKLSKTAQIKFVFHPDKCILQDPQTEAVLAVGKVVGNLYILDKSSFHDTTFFCFL
uniref:Retrovirus-related Pol polyprotein from transposon TNT 1-94-like beta-barrel domain-containing protein n=1 Tax=Nelumbo nucifera TaxID=4432 RepID=A0A822YVG7_NELNU|nr:TPA_asm: hypothetical protein HUJ06_012089 [Nelumbo nucifera]